MVTLGILVLSTSLLLQVIVTVLAFRLIKVTGRRAAWIFIWVAVALMSARRLVPLLHMIFGAVAFSPDLMNETFGLIVSALMVAGIARITPILVSIRRSEKEARESKEWLFTTLKSIGDAVITTDTRGNITLMNPIAQALTGRKEEEAVGRPLKEVFFTIDEKTGEPKEDPASRVIRTNNVVGLDNHTLLMTKRGTTLTIDDSAAPIKDDQGNIVGVVLIFRDVTERRQAEEAIRLAHRELDLIFNTAADGMRVIDKDFNMIRINERFLPLVGLKKEDIIGRKCYEVFPGSTCHTENCSMKRIISGEDYLEYDVEKIRQGGDGETITCLMTATAMRRNDGELVGIIEDFKDITERKRTEELLLCANMVIENSQTVLFRWRAEEGWPVAFVSENVIQFGYSSEELLSGSISYQSMIYPEDLDRVTQEVRHYTGQKISSFQQEYRLVTREGKVRWVDDRTVAEYDSAGQIAYYQGVVIDITERKKAEEALRQTEVAKAERQRLFSVLDVLPAIVFLHSPGDYTIPFANRKFREFLGDPEGRPCHAILHGLEDCCAECRIPHLLDGSDAHKWEWISSDNRTFEMYECAFTDIDGSQMILEMGIDITDRIQMDKARKDAERQLEEQRARAILSDHLRSLGEMATGIAHELNQPLTGVRGLAEQIIIGLRRGWQVSEESIREKIQMIIEQSDRMTHVIEHVRMFARGANKAEFSPIQINEVIKSSMELIGAQLRYRGLALDFELAENLPSVLANSFSLEEVILNLINNARDAIMEEVEQAGKDSPHIVVRTFEEHEGSDRFIKIEVIDHGIGIPRECMTRVFDPFFTTKGPDQGTGLGLAISKSIIEGFHGTIGIESTPGLGTRVTITLPAFAEQ